MSEIKFRAWEHSKNRFLTNYDTLYLSDEGNCYRLKGTNYNGDYLDKEDVETNLFSGLKDCNGKEIYINNLPTEKEVVEWYSGLNRGGPIHTEKDLAPA